MAGLILASSPAVPIGAADTLALKDMNATTPIQDRNFVLLMLAGVERPVPGAEAPGTGPFRTRAGYALAARW